MDASPLYTDGHEEIEIALLKLSRHTGNPAYRELAKRLLDRRGKIRFFGLHFSGQSLSAFGRMNAVRRMRKEYYQQHPDKPITVLPGHNQHLVPRFIPFRFLWNALSGKYTQQEKPLREKMIPEGHAVRFGYLNTAAAMLARDERDSDMTDHLSQVWENMVSRRMYVTGGIGSLPLIEGFGRDYELDPEVAYAETCAALGSMLWSHEMSLNTANPRYEDLFEWQLYNAASVGMGQDGKSYFYNNPLVCRRGLKRAAWYDIPCCPSNLSRVWASLRDAVLSADENNIEINQFISGEYALENGTRFHIKSGIPWTGDVSIMLDLDHPRTLGLRIRVPAWAGACELSLNGEGIAYETITFLKKPLESAVGIHFEDAYYAGIKREFYDGDRIDIHFPMPIVLRKQDKRIRGCGGMVAVTRGPIVYCLESIDNAEDIFSAEIEPESIQVLFDPLLFRGTTKITARSTNGAIFTWIPYMFWGNRGESQMSVFFRATDKS